MADTKSIIEPIFTTNSREKPNCMTINYIFRELKASNYLDLIIILTDGSKQISGRVGAAAYIKNYEKTIEWRVSDIHTVVSVELFAIYKALSLIDDGNSRNDV